MAEIKKIKCRVCGKLYKPCLYCQSHSDTFRWRNFACSKECAVKYINGAQEYRKNKNKGKMNADKTATILSNKNVTESTPPKKKQKENLTPDIPIDKAEQSN